MIEASSLTQTSATLPPHHRQAKVKLLRTGGSSSAAKEARAELRAWISPEVLPRSLGGRASFGVDGDCCDGAVHNSFLQAGEAGHNAGVAVLESFAGVAPHEIEAVRQLQRYLAGARFQRGDLLRKQPVYVRGEVALLRIVRFPQENVERIRAMLNARLALDSSTKAQVLREGGRTLHTLPGAETMRAATWQTNEWAGLDAHGDLVMYERWGALDPATVLEKLEVEEFAEWNAFRFEARAIVLDMLSRRALRVVRFAIVIDMEGTGFRHRKLMPYIKAFAGGASTDVVPSMRSTTHFIRCGKVASNIFRLAGRMGILSANLKATTFLIAGPNPFEESPDFDSRFRRDALPATVGGTLKVGTASMLMAYRNSAHALSEHIFSKSISLTFCAFICRTSTAALASICPLSPTRMASGQGTLTSAILRQ